jgi:general secretion pathway protein G
MHTDNPSRTVRACGLPWRARLRRRLAVLRSARPPRSARALPGFTLIEVLVVLVILALLAGIVTTQLLAPAEEAKADATKVQVKAIMASLDLYRLHNSSYPTTEQGLAALLRRPEVGIVPETWRGPYLNSNNLPSDGWKRQFLYASDGRTYVITSLGADGSEGGTGLNADIRSTDL